MLRIKFLPALVAASLAAFAGHAGAQAGPNPEPPNRKPAVTLRVQLVLSRFEGDKKLASLPYTFLVSTAANGTTGSPVQMRMGVDTPIPMKSTPDGGKEGTTISYRTIGTNIDCNATELADGRYKLFISVENTSVPQTANARADGLAPIIRRFETRLEPMLRDGESTQAVASTDPVTGEVVKIDVTMNVVK